tara:strand:- start:1593 stop:1985 length:393 start_codon:yes stop_codon:yes gene_type:complete
MIIDTTFAIDVMRNEPKAVEKLHALLSKKGMPHVTSPTIFEIFSGVAQSNKPDSEKEKVLDLLANQIIVDLDEKSAEEGGKIDGTLVKEGKMIDPVDSMIAGIAITKGHGVLTRNLKHFSRVKDLKVETY